MFLGIAIDTWAMLATLLAGLLAVSYELWLPALQTGGTGVLAWFKTKPVTTDPDAGTDTGGDPDVLDFKAAKRLRERFKKLHCDEGLQAMQTVFEHFFHEEESE